jgi:hypothetical protein
MLYHLVPHRIAGPRLLPLNCLREPFPELYDVHLRKYAGRGDLLLEQVPGLECLWNDVLFMTAVPPLQIRELHEEAGIALPPLRWFEIDPAELEPGRLQVYWYRHDGRDRKYEPDNWEPFRMELLTQLRSVPRATREHYVDAARAGRRPLVFFRIPHVLYHGSLDIDRLLVIEG